MMRFKVFSDSNMGRLENTVNAFLIENNIRKEEIVDFNVAHDKEMFSCCVTILYRFCNN